MSLDKLLESVDGFNRVAAHREPGGGIVLMLSHRVTLDGALLVYVPSDAHIATLDSDIGVRINEGGAWNE